MGSVTKVGDESIAELQTVELTPRVPIRLAVVTRSDPARFKAAFMDAWRRLPQYARDALAEHSSNRLTVVEALALNAEVGPRAGVRAREVIALRAAVRNTSA